MDRLGPHGEARGQSGEYRIELKRGVPGDLVRVETSSRRRTAVLARLVTLLSPSSQRVAPRCRHARACGGCRFQEFEYEGQLAEKHRIAHSILHSAGVLGANAPVIERVLPAPSIWNYRTKMDFSFSNRRWLDEREPADAPADFALGLHPRDFHAKVIDVEQCEIQFGEANRILASVRELAKSHALIPWDVTGHHGLLRHLVLRKSRASGEILVNLVTFDESAERIRPFARELELARPEITTLVQSLHSTNAQAALSEREIVLFGPGFIREKLGRVEFRLSANSFFQTNAEQAEHLLELVVEECAATKSDVLFDLYCGAGAFTLPMARLVREAFGFELVDSSIRDARDNAATNAIENAHFVAGDLCETIAADLTKSGPARPEPNLCVVDPPRAGLHPKVVETLARIPARRIVYVSCNLTSAARDAKVLVDAGWRLARVRPIDLFPHTPHLETVLTFERGA